jgi:hypothetical protein
MLRALVTAVYNRLRVISIGGQEYIGIIMTGYSLP